MAWWIKSQQMGMAIEVENKIPQMLMQQLS
jgi:hypothetical protein